MIYNFLRVTVTTAMVMCNKTLNCSTVPEKLCHEFVYWKFVVLLSSAGMQNKYYKLNWIDIILLVPQGEIFYSYIFYVIYTKLCTFPHIFWHIFTREGTRQTTVPSGLPVKVQECMNFNFPVGFVACFGIEFQLLCDLIILIVSCPLSSL